MRGILIFFVVFGILVFVHEFGHFIVAKKSGVLVREFSIGMGPKLFQVKRNPTTYTIRWLPLGGYVRLAGAEDESKLDPGMNVILQLNRKKEVVRIDASESELPIEGIPVQVTKADLVDKLVISGFKNGDQNHPVTYRVNHDARIIDKTKTELIIAPRDTQFQEANIWQKLATNVAGPMMNIVLGFAVFLIWTFTVPGPATTTVAKTVPNMPAQEARIASGDRITAVNHHQIDHFQSLAQAINQSQGRIIQLTVQKGARKRTVRVKPKARVVGEKKVYEIGIEAATNENPFLKFQRGLQTASSTTGLIFQAIGNLFTHFNLNKLAGPVGIYSETSQVSQLGFSYVLEFLGMISINLGLVNLIPIPGLDGGKLLLNLVELVRGRPLTQDHETVIELIGFAFLLILIIAVTGNDIYRYFMK